MLSEGAPDFSGLTGRSITGTLVSAGPGAIVNQLVSGRAWKVEHVRTSASRLEIYEKFRCRDYGCSGFLDFGHGVYGSIWSSSLGVRFHCAERPLAKGR